MLMFEYVDNNSRIRHYSNMNMMIRQKETNILYEDAVDYLPCKYTYEETDIPIESEEEEIEDMISSRNISNNEYFQLGDNLYYSTSSIASGENIEVGVNCELVELSDVLNELKEN